MACTTILVGKKASYDGSTIIARNDDSGQGMYTAKKYQIINPSEQPRKYTTVISHLTMDLPDNPLRYSATPNVDRKDGIWCASGINELEAGMSATETITSNPRVLGADPLVKYDEKTNTPGGIGEEDIVHIVLPYIHSAREGVTYLGSLLEKYGTYESNGIAFCDRDEIWYLETIGGHHFIAKRVVDDEYVVLPNQLNIDYFDLDDAFGKQEKHICSKDLREFIEDNHLDLGFGDKFDVRAAFGSHSDADHVYNTPRAWYMLRYFNPNTFDWEHISPECDSLPFSMKPERKITIEDVKYILSSHYQGTEYDPYVKGEKSNLYRSIGVNRTDDLEILQMRSYGKPLEYQAFASNVYNVTIPQYTCVNKAPEYLSCTTTDVNTNSFYWTSRLIATLGDSDFYGNVGHIERYQLQGAALANKLIKEFDKTLEGLEGEELIKAAEHANQVICDEFEKLSTDVLGKVLKVSTNRMKNAYQRNDN